MSDTTLTLEARLDLKTAGQTATAILEHDGQDLILDAGQVTHMGAMGLQVLRAAACSWAEKGQTLSFINASDECADQLSLLGFTPDTITIWEDAI